MTKHPVFTFGPATLDRAQGMVELQYQLDDETFKEILMLPDVPMRNDDVTGALQALHLIGGISYYKAKPTNKIVIQDFALTPRQKEFWDTVYTKGLGEFWYRNKIDFRGMINFPADEQNEQFAVAPILEPRPVPQKLLVPVGGGKDSLVTIEALRKAGADITLLRIGSHPIIDEIAKISDLPLLTVDRRIDPALIKLNAQGALNGHIPVTAYHSALAVLIAQLYGFDAVVFSNERSAEFGSIIDYHGLEVNHQWSKSWEFEQLFSSYIASFISQDIQYFSFLRPWSELRIAEEFAKYPEYFGVATSCNVNWRLFKERPTERWCRQCPKCAFVYALMAASLDRTVVDQMFGGCMFEDLPMLIQYRELLGLEGVKPFECVGTPDEAKAAFLLAHRNGGYEDTAAMNMFMDEVYGEIADQETLLTEVRSASGGHLVPAAFLPYITDAA